MWPMCLLLRDIMLEILVNFTWYILTSIFGYTLLWKRYTFNRYWWQNRKDLSHHLWVSDMWTTCSQALALFCIFPLNPYLVQMKLLAFKGFFLWFFLCCLLIQKARVWPSTSDSDINRTDLCPLFLCVSNSKFGGRVKQGFPPHHSSG